jgi:hypothetical protein
MLGAAGCVVAFFELSSVRKGIAIALLSLLMILELRSIYHDREEVETQHTAEQKEMRDDFASVLKQNQDSFSSTSAYLNSVIGGMERVFKGVTGGDSFVYLMPQTHVFTEPCKSPSGIEQPSALAFTAENAGDYPMIGVKIQFQNLKDLPLRANDVFYTLPDTDIPTIAPHSSIHIKGVLCPDINTNGEAAYWIFIYAQNGLVTQTLRLRKHNGGLPWAFTFTVNREHDNTDPHGPIFPHVLKNQEWSDDLGDGKPIATNPPAAPPPSPAPPAPPEKN